MNFLRKVALVLFLVLCIILLFIILFFAAILKGIDKYGGEMGDTFGLLICLCFILYLLPFIYWSLQVFKNRIIGKSYLANILAIVLLSIVFPVLFYYLLGF